MSEHGAREIRVPQLGEGLREARIVELLRAPGAPLRRGDRLYVIETDKTTVELEAPFDGTLLEWRVAVGDALAAIPSASNKLLPDDIDRFLAARAAESPDSEGMREIKVTGGHRALIFRLRRSATLVIPGTLAIDVPWSDLEAPG